MSPRAGPQPQPILCVWCCAWQSWLSDGGQPDAQMAKLSVHTWDRPGLQFVLDQNLTTTLILAFPGLARDSSSRDFALVGASLTSGLDRPKRRLPGIRVPGFYPLGLGQAPLGWSLLEIPTSGTGAMDRGVQGWPSSQECPPSFLTAIHTHCRQRLGTPRLPPTPGPCLLRLPCPCRLLPQALGDPSGWGQ